MKKVHMQIEASSALWKPQGGLRKRGDRRDKELEALLEGW